MKMITTSIVALFACAAFANPPAAPKADAKAAAPAAAAAPAGDKAAAADKCHGKTGADLKKCETEHAPKK